MMLGDISLQSLQDFLRDEKLKRAVAITTNMLCFYNERVVNMICDKYGLSSMDALRRFLFSETYQMLCNPNLEMWDLGPLGIFDMWESEQVTGNPRNSLYCKEDL